MKNPVASAIATLLATCITASAVQAEQWLFDDQYLLGGLGYEDKMPNREKYNGTKLIAQGRYILNRKDEPVDQKRQCCEIPSLPTEYRGVLEASLRYGFESKDLEYVGLGVTPWARMWDPGPTPSTGGHHPRQGVGVGLGGKLGLGRGARGGAGCVQSPTSLMIQWMTKPHGIRASTTETARRAMTSHRVRMRSLQKRR